jgi:integrase/recombinase XerD
MPKRRGKAPPGCLWRGNVLYGRTQVKGRDHWWSLGTDDPKIARERLKAGKERLIAAHRFGEVRLTYDELLEQWRGWIENESELGVETQVRYAVSLGQLDSFLTGRFVDEINGKLIAEIVKQRAEKVTNATVRRDLGALSSVMNYAIDQGLIEGNPVLPRLRRIKERRDPIVLPVRTDIELVTLRAPGLMAELIRAAIVTGAREDELVEAQRSALDLARKQLTIIGKGRKLRVIDLEPFGGAELFERLPAAPNGSHRLFWHQEGEPYRNFASQFAALVARTAAWAREHSAPFRRFRFHDLRHYHAVAWLKDGRPIYDLQKRLGHSSIKTTEVYLAFLTPDEERIAKGMAGRSKSRSNRLRTGTE